MIARPASHLGGQVETHVIWLGSLESAALHALAESDRVSLAEALNLAVRLVILQRVGAGRVARPLRVAPERGAARARVRAAAPGEAGRG